MRGNAQASIFCNASFEKILIIAKFSNLMGANGDKELCTVLLFLSVGNGHTVVTAR
jgi:hypothetical protein